MKKTAGYALLEIVACIALSAIIIVATAAAFSSAARFNAMARDRLHDEITVQNAAEAVLARGVSEAALTTADGKTVGEVTVGSETVPFKVLRDEGAYYEIELTRGDISLSLKTRKIP